MREVSVMFTDIAGFSKVSQRKHPEDLVKLLNGYYEEAISAVHGTDGVVIDLIGDAIFALWNAPETQADHAGRASRTALALHRKLLKFDEANDGAPLRTRVGLHRGPVCVGNVGSTQRFNYTAIGDAVNLASRLEGLNKQLGTDILATRDIQREVENSLITRPVGQFRFKGFDKVAEVYELLDIEAAPPWFGEFREALRHFQRREWDAAEAGFRKVGTMRSAEQRGNEPGDAPSAFYLKQIEALRRSPPPDDWLGEIDLREK
jgi:adenylate cyclase